MKFWHKLTFKQQHVIKTIFTIILLLIIPIIFLIIFNNSNTKNINEQTLLLFNISIENWSYILNTEIIIFTASLALYQYNKNTKLKQQEKASKIAEYFSDTLINRLDIISEVLLSEQTIQDIIYVNTHYNLGNFTFLNLEQIYKGNENTEKAIHTFNTFIHSDICQKKYENIISTKYTQYENQKFEKNFPRFILHTLNHLEAICIDISSNAAGSQFIYTSLHQPFLRIVELLTIPIACNNTNNIDKFYANIITTYKTWNKQKNKDKKIFKKKNKKIQKLNLKVKKEIYKLLNKENTATL